MSTATTSGGFPRPSLVVLVGAAGSGKSAWASKRFSPNEILSIDALRAMAGTDSQDGAATPAAFDLLDTIVRIRMNRGLTAVVDSDGLESRRRIRWLESAGARSVPAYAVLFAANLDTCLSRNAGRPDPLPEAIVRRQVARTLEIGPDIAAEGFDVFVVFPPSEGSGRDGG